MNILALDYGKKKIGVAFASTIISEPLTVLRYSDEYEVIRKIKEIVKKLDVKKVILGVSEGKSAKESQEFGNKLNNSGIDVEYVDETLTTKEAQKYSIEAKVGRKKRKQLEDAYAAAVMLQCYLEKNV
jgi:putative Holliday junction resolvase